MPNQCPRCKKTVYFAEELRAAGHVWHKLCLKCKECNKLLSSTNIRDKEGRVTGRGVVIGYIIGQAGFL